MYLKHSSSHFSPYSHRMLWWRQDEIPLLLLLPLHCSPQVSVSLWLHVRQVSPQQRTVGGLPLLFPSGPSSSSLSSGPLRGPLPSFCSARHRWWCNVANPRIIAASPPWRDRRLSCKAAAPRFPEYAAAAPSRPAEASSAASSAGFLLLREKSERSDRCFVAGSQDATQWAPPNKIRPSVGPTERIKYAHVCAPPYYNQLARHISISFHDSTYIYMYVCKYACMYFWKLAGLLELLEGSLRWLIVLISLDRS